MDTLSSQDNQSMQNDTLPSASTANHDFVFPYYANYPPFYSLQRNLETRAKQFEWWSALITSYCAHHRIFRLSLSSTPPDLFSRPLIRRHLKPADVRAVLDHMSLPENGSRIEWILPSVKGEQSSTCHVFWKTPAEWADAIYQWVDETGQKGTVLTMYELREGDAVANQEWCDMDEGMLRRIIAVLVKRAKAQVFGQEESAGVKFF